MSGRLREMFESLKGQRAALITYATGCYPGQEESVQAALTMLENGADAVEIGVPFSDPVMDGPVIQEASAAALAAGATPAKVLEAVSRVRAKTDKPILLMTYYNPDFHYGLIEFAREARGAGADGVIIPDLPAEEMGPWAAASGEAGMDTVAFASLTSNDSRIREASRISTGFIYCIALLGTTGERERVSPELPAFLARVRKLSEKPIAAGLGVSGPEQCRAVGQMADAVIVGSALVREMARGEGDLSGLMALTASLAGSLALGSGPGEKA